MHHDYNMFVICERNERILLSEIVENVLGEKPFSFKTRNSLIWPAPLFCGVSVLCSSKFSVPFLVGHKNVGLNFDWEKFVIFVE